MLQTPTSRSPARSHVRGIFPCAAKFQFAEIRAHYDALDRDSSHFVNRNDICTPLGCVQQMVDTVPNAFWRQPNLKVLDACCGNGNFHAYIATKTNLENLYFNEINARRVRNLKQYFGDRIHLTTQDFLTYYESEQFDMVVANPPYAKFTNGVRTAKNHNMARAFIAKALRITKAGGYLLFIVPNNWMSFSDRNKLPRLLSRYQFRHLNIHGAKQWFPQVGSSFTWFLLQKIANAEPFTIENHYVLRNTKRVTLPSDVNFVPLYYDRMVARIVRKVVAQPAVKYAVETSSDLHKYTKQELFATTESQTHPYKIRHTPTQTIWSRRPHKFQYGPKVFLSLTNQYRTFIDACGMTQSIAFIRCRSRREAARVKAELDHPVFRFINNITRYGNFNNIRVLQNLSRLGSFKLTQQEESFVQRFNDAYYGKSKQS